MECITSECPRCRESCALETFRTRGGRATAVCRACIPGRDRYTIKRWGTRPVRAPEPGQSARDEDPPAEDPPEVIEEEERGEGRACSACHETRPVRDFVVGARTFKKCTACRFGPRKPRAPDSVKCSSCQRWCAPALFAREGTEKTYKQCTACRDYRREHTKQWTAKRKQAAPPDGMRYCQACKRDCTVDAFTPGPSGDLFVSCDPCRLRSKEWYDDTRETRLEVSKAYNEREKDMLQKKRKERYQKNAEAVKETMRVYNNTPRGKLVRMIRRAAERGIAWDLDNENTVALIKTPCFYCHRSNVNDRMNGIDRLCSDGIYAKDNCVSCCWPCNNAKGSLDPKTFVRRMSVVDALWGARVAENTAAHLWGVTRSVAFAGYATTTKCGEPFGIPRDVFDELTARQCVYCARPSMCHGSGRHGLDRIDNAVGYRVTNVRPCCRECNFMRGDMTLDAFRDLAGLVAAREDVILASIPEGITQCLVQRMTRNRKTTRTNDESDDGAANKT